MSVLVDGDSFVKRVGEEEVVELASQGVGGWPAEVLGDHHDALAPAQPDGPDALGGTTVGADVGVFDLDEDIGSTDRGPGAGGPAVG